MLAFKKEIKEQLPDIRFNEPLAKYSTFGIGGPADFFYTLKDNELLPSIIKLVNSYNVPVFIFGGGSNILFDDKGFRGIVIKIATKNISVNGTKITADAGVSVSALVKKSMDSNLAGLEKWIGLPGTVGGAIRGNAGCNGLETKDILTKAILINPKNGNLREATNKYLHFSYRYSKLKKTGEIVLSATFKLNKRTITKEEQNKILKQYTTSRIKKHPFGATTGSFFKNPHPDKPAGMLIEQAGLKGEIIGGAEISKKHANFILNIGKASSTDIIELAKLARERVKAKFDIKLEEEVQIVSERGLIPL